MDYVDYSATLGISGSVDVLRKASRSENTRAAYEKGWQCFVSWCQDQGLVPEESGADDVVRFLVAMATKGRPGRARPLALNTLRLYRSALNDRSRRMGLHPAASERVVDEILRGLARLRGDNPRRVKAIREHQMIAMLDSCGRG